VVAEWLLDSPAPPAGATAVAGDPTAGATGNNFDVASAAGGTKFTETVAGSATPTAGAEAFAGFNGSGDSASAVGQGARAQAGVSDTATPANFDSALVWGNVNTPTPDEANALIGSNDAAFVIDPVGTMGSSAWAGEGFNFDLAGVFGDALHATTATTANFMVDILPSL
jgi:hypothetical protein